MSAIVALARELVAEAVIENRVQRRARFEDAALRDVEATMRRALDELAAIRDEARGLSVATVYQLRTITLQHLARCSRTALELLEKGHDE